MIAKLTAPNNVNTIRRDRLIERLESPFSNASWIYAPPGFGKTTLLADYLEHSPHRGYWYQISIDDLNPRSFFNLLTQLFDSKDAKLELSYLLQDAQIFDIPRFSQQFFNLLYKHQKTPFNIVFDDCHIAPDENVLHEIFSVLIENLPQHGHVYFVSRKALPQQLSRHYVNRKIEILTAEELTFNQEESKNLLRSLKAKDETRYNKIIDISSGWAAGLIILGLENGQSATYPNIHLSENSLLESYFHSEITKNIDEEKISTLTKLSVFSYFTPEMGAEIADVPIDCIQSLLSELLEKNYFLEHRGKKEKHYRFHPLFKEHLSNLLNDKFKHKQLNTQNFISLASTLMQNDEQIEDAAFLLIEYEQWGTLEHLCLKQAEYILDKGRHETLLGWMESIPEEHINDVKWYNYWLAKAHLPFKPKYARKLLVKAYELFADDSNDRDQSLTCASIIESYIYDADEFLSSTPWIEKLETLHRKLDSSLSVEQEAALTEAQISLLQWVTNSNIDTDALLQRAGQLLFILDKPRLIIRLGAAIVRYSIVRGDHNNSPVILKKLRSYTELKQLSVLDKVMLQYAICVASSLCRDLRSEDGTHLLNALAEASTLKMSIIQFQARVILIQGAILYGNKKLMEHTERELSNLYTDMDHGKCLDNAYYYYIAGWHNVRKLNIAKAREELALSITYAKNLSVLAPSHPLLPIIALEIRERNFRAAEEHIQHLENIVEKCEIGVPQIKLWFAKIGLSIEKGPDANTQKLCEDTFSYCRKNKVYDVDGRVTWFMTPIFQFALEHKIESEHVKEMIIYQGLQEDYTSQTCVDWPWPIKINLLGDLKITLDKSEISLTKKTPKKVVSLLKLLVSNNRHPVLVSTAIKTLWDNEDKTKADNVFKSTVLRLRKLLGKSAVIVENGYIFLNQRKVWVDAWALHHVLNASDRSENNRNLDITQDLYAGDFIIDPSSEPWLTSYQDKLQKQYIEFLDEHCKNAITNNQLDKAQILCEEIFRIDDRCDTAHYNKIKILVTQKKNSEAILAFRKYQQIMYKYYSTKPSENIENLIKCIQIE